jgi:ABC-type transporter Mla maintaining outer membrane lipid asymmetry permease subunit MlaE
MSDQVYTNKAATAAIVAAVGIILGMVLAFVGFVVLVAMPH